MGRVEDQIKDNYNSLSHEGERLNREAKIETEKLKNNAKLDAKDMKKDIDDSVHSSWETVKEGAKTVQDYISGGIESVKHTITPEPAQKDMENLKHNVNQKLDEGEKEGSSVLNNISNFFKGSAEEARSEAERIGYEAYKDGDQFVGDVHKNFKRTTNDTQKDANRLASDVKNESNKIFKDIKDESNKLYNDVKGESSKIYNGAKKEGSKLATDLKKDTQYVADETKKMAADLKNKATDTYQDLSHDASKKATQLKKKASETLDESADAIEHQYDIMKKDFRHLNQRNGMIWGSIGLIGGATATSYLFPSASPMAKFTFIAGLASLGGYYGLHQPHNKIVDNAFHKANNRKEELKKKI
ncbi:hypothetical protein ACTFIR_004390 [Dictyostelium discoideum]